jgi:hypothetical protein
MRRRLNERFDLSAECKDIDAQVSRADQSWAEKVECFHSTAINFSRHAFNHLPRNSGPMLAKIRDSLSRFSALFAPKRPFLSEEEKQQLWDVPDRFYANALLGGSLCLLQELTTRILEDEFLFLEYGDAFTWALHYGFFYAISPAVETVTTVLLKPNFQGYPLARVAYSAAIHSICGYVQLKREKLLLHNSFMPRPVWDPWWAIANKAAPLAPAIAAVLPAAIREQGLFARDITAGCVATLGWSLATVKPQKGRSALAQYLMDFPVVMFDNATIAGMRYCFKRIGVLSIN